MPKAVVITICVVVILICIGVIWRREGERRRQQLRGDSRPPELVCQVGTFRFRWALGEATISMLMMGAGEAEFHDKLIAHIETTTPEGEKVPYHWNPFKDWCERVVAEMAKAQVREETPGLCRDCNQPLHQRHTPECPRNQARPGDRPDEVRLTDTPPPTPPTSSAPKREHRGGC